MNLFYINANLETISSTANRIFYILAERDYRDNSISEDGVNLICDNLYSSACVLDVLEERGKFELIVDKLNLLGIRTRQFAVILSMALKLTEISPKFGISDVAKAVYLVLMQVEHGKEYDPSESRIPGYWATAKIMAEVLRQDSQIVAEINTFNAAVRRLIEA